MIPQPKLRPRPGEDSYELIEEYVYKCTIDNDLIEITVPAGFIYDGASVPAIGWIATYTPFHPDVMLPALVHDYIYTEHPVDRFTADSIFWQMLIDNGVKRLTADVMHTAVRAGGSGSWEI